MNLYILWRRSLDAPKKETTFANSSMTLFQQRWRSKRFVRGYHGDYIPEKKFKRWYLPTRLPDVRIHKTDLGRKQEADYLEIVRQQNALKEQAQFASRGKDVKPEEKKLAKANTDAASTPLGSLMFIEVERRLDTFIFRCCFAPSVYAARLMVLHGKVLVNGFKVSYAIHQLGLASLADIYIQTAK